MAWYDALYLVPLSFSIIVLSFAVIASAIVSFLSTRKIVSELQLTRFAIRDSTAGLDLTRSDLATSRTEIRRDSDAVREQMVRVCVSTEKLIEKLRRIHWWLGEDHK